LEYIVRSSLGRSYPILASVFKKIIGQGPSLFLPHDGGIHKWDQARTGKKLSDLLGGIRKGHANFPLRGGQTGKKGLGLKVSTRPAKGARNATITLTIPIIQCSPPALRKNPYF